MSNKKTFNLIIGLMLLVVGVIFILCGVFSNLIDILLGVACCVAAVAIATKSLITNKKLLNGSVVGSAALLAVGIALFVLQNIGGFVQFALDIALMAVGLVILIDTIIWFVKKRNLAINIVELVIAVALITIGIISVIPSVDVGSLVFYFSGAVLCFAGIVVIIASLVNFKKYTNPQNQAPAKKTNKK